MSAKQTQLEYFINLDERGEFCADVRRGNKTVFEIQGQEIFEDGFMNHKNDLSGLKDYLVWLSVMDKKEELVFGN